MEGGKAWPGIVQWGEEGLRQDPDFMGGGSWERRMRRSWDGKGGQGENSEARPRPTCPSYGIQDLGLSSPMAYTWVNVPSLEKYKGSWTTVQYRHAPRVAFWAAGWT